MISRSVSTAERVNMGPGDRLTEGLGLPGYDRIVRPLVMTGQGFRIGVGILLAVLVWAAYAYSVQLRNGLVVTGMSHRVSWGLYISNFVFFIGISHAGTLVSAILRVTGAEWRRPITRMAEAITVFALMVGAPMILIDMGRPDRLLNLLIHGRIQSPIVWDFLSVTAYLFGSMLFLYLPMIPDLARCRDHVKGLSTWKHKLYTVLAMGWQDTPQQHELLERGMKIMSIVIIPVAISVHTVVSWIFGMTLRTGWHSTIFGPYFVVGAIYSGIAAIIVAMALFRRIYRLEPFITKDHFNKLSLLLLTVNLVYLYFTISEYLTIAYGGEKSDAALIEQLTAGKYAPAFWATILFGLAIPALILSFRWGRRPTGAVIASILVNLGMFAKRYLIVIPTMALPQNPESWAGYAPTWVEWSITFGGLAAFTLLYILFSKVFPIVSIWELQEAADKRGQAA